jgi:integrase
MAATVLLLQDVEIRTVMSIMGWTETATAERYTHAVDELRRRAARQMGTCCGTSPGVGSSHR